MLDKYLTRSWALPFLSFLAWLERAGLAYINGRETDVYARWTRLLPAGSELFDLTNEDHPLLPALLTDTQTCLGHDLERPAVVRIGVAFETMIAAVHESLLQRGYQLQPASPRNAAERITAVGCGIALRIPGPKGEDRDARAAAEDVCVLADQLRRRRNDGSHLKARYPLDDRQEVEELLVSGGRHLPALWKCWTSPPANAMSAAVIARPTPPSRSQSAAGSFAITAASRSTSSRRWRAMSRVSRYPDQVGSERAMRAIAPVRRRSGAVILAEAHGNRTHHAAALAEHHRF